MAKVDFKTRIEGVLKSMTLEEKIGQLTMVQGHDGEAGKLTDAQLERVREGGIGSVLNISASEPIRGAQAAAKQSRLGIPLLVTLDVLHGYETIFPIPLAEAATFDPALWEATARAAAQEAAAASIHLTFAPMLDVSRDARWGRMAESPGEDPCVGARFAEAKVFGFQQGLDQPDTLAATAKHLGAYGAVTAGRDYNSVDISARSLHEIHLTPFAAAVRAGVAAIMPSFNDLAGMPMTANYAILRNIVRERWGFEGVIVSDFNAIAELMTHGVAADLAEAAALAMKAGVDIDMVSDAYPKGLPVALERGLIEEVLIDEAVRRVLKLKERLGLFDDALRGQSSDRARPDYKVHRELARDAARRSMVLLQNREDLLPLRGEGKRLAVIGPLAADQNEILGPWRAVGQAEQAKSFLSGIIEAMPGWQITHQAGSGVLEEHPRSFVAALDAAKNADIILLCLGEASRMSGEAASRACPDLPQCQRRLADAVLSLGKPVTVVLVGGRPLTVPWLFEKSDAVVAAWFPGSEAGSALADILTGRCNPSGKLPVSWPADIGQMPLFYAHLPTGRPANPDDPYTSRYIDAPVEPLFPFGHGLSYTHFSYSNLRLSNTAIGPKEQVIIKVDIRNDGEVKGEETAFLFIRDPTASIARPVLELKGIAKIVLAAGAKDEVRFTLSCDDVSFPDETGMMVLEPGAIEIMVGPRADPKSLLKKTLQIKIDGDGSDGFPLQS
jgi:beta-glucosidase